MSDVRGTMPPLCGGEHSHSEGRAPKTGYTVTSTVAWSDVDKNGCDTRNDILRRDPKTSPIQGTAALYAFSLPGVLVSDPLHG